MQAEFLNRSRRHNGYYCILFIHKNGMGYSQGWYNPLLPRVFSSSTVSVPDRWASKTEVQIFKKEPWEKFFELFVLTQKPPVSLRGNSENWHRDVNDLCVLRVGQKAPNQINHQDIKQQFVFAPKKVNLTKKKNVLLKVPKCYCN